MDKQFPREINSNIFSYLYPEDLGELRRTGKSLRKYIDDDREYINLRMYNNHHQSFSFKDFSQAMQNNLFEELIGKNGNNINFPVNFDVDGNFFTKNNKYYANGPIRGTIYEEDNIHPITVTASYKEHKLDGIYKLSLIDSDGYITYLDIKEYKNGKKTNVRVYMVDYYLSIVKYEGNIKKLVSLPKIIHMGFELFYEKYPELENPTKEGLDVLFSHTSIYNTLTVTEKGIKYKYIFDNSGGDMIFEKVYGDGGHYIELVGNITYNTGENIHLTKIDQYIFIIETSRVGKKELIGYFKKEGDRYTLKRLYFISFSNIPNGKPSRGHASARIYR